MFFQSVLEKADVKSEVFFKRGADFFSYTVTGCDDGCRQFVCFSRLDVVMPGKLVGIAIVDVTGSGHFGVGAKQALLV